VGTTIAYNLSQVGIQDVPVLEKNTVCSSDTAYSCAIVRTHYSNPLTCKRATIGRDVLAEFPHRVGGESGFRRYGYLISSESAVSGSQASCPVASVSISSVVRHDPLRSPRLP
jgi:glycine/D-amino acid oxidase-like deaminating enzyme